MWVGEGGSGECTVPLATRVAMAVAVVVVMLVVSMVVRLAVVTFACRRKFYSSSFARSCASAWRPPTASTSRSCETLGGDQSQRAAAGSYNTNESLRCL